MIYALMFESKFPEGQRLEQTIVSPAQNLIGSRNNVGALPDRELNQISDFTQPPMGNWRDTNELTEPHSVVESTTKFLETPAEK